MHYFYSNVIMGIGFKQCLKLFAVTTSDVSDVFDSVQFYRRSDKHLGDFVYFLRNRRGLRCKFPRVFPSIYRNQQDLHLFLPNAARLPKLRYDHSVDNFFGVVFNDTSESDTNER